MIDVRMSDSVETNNSMFEFSEVSGEDRRWFKRYKGTVDRIRLPDLRVGMYRRMGRLYQNVIIHRRNGVKEPIETLAVRWQQENSGHINAKLKIKGSPDTGKVKKRRR